MLCKLLGLRYEFAALIKGEALVGAISLSLNPLSWKLVNLQLFKISVNFNPLKYMYHMSPGS